MRRPGAPLDFRAEVDRGPDNANALALGAGRFAWQGDLTRGEEWAKRSIEAETDNWGARYNVVCAYAVMNQPEMALEHLEYMARHMPRTRRWLHRIAKIDAELDTLRERPDYQALMKRIEGELAAPS